MGFLHEGHLSLVRKSKETCDRTIVSIFVNPTQFAPTEDLSDYPRDIERDKKLLFQENVDYIFIPSVEEIYPENYQTYVTVEHLSKKLEGEFRSTHFRGVTTIVSILFNTVIPDFAFFGQKDAQQAAVIRQMVNDLRQPIKIVVCPIVREKDGLAMSSRNIYLSEQERKDAIILHDSLQLGTDLIEKGERRVNVVLSDLNSSINEVKSATLDYLKIVEVNSFEIVDELEKGKEYYLLIACRIGKTRLIDNKKIKIS